MKKIVIGSVAVAIAAIVSFSIAFGVQETPRRFGGAFVPGGGVGAFGGGSAGLLSVFTGPNAIGPSDIADNTSTHAVTVGGANASTLGVVNVGGSGLPTATYGGTPGSFYVVQGITNNGFVMARATVDTVGAKITIYKTRNVDASVPTAVIASDELGRVSAAAATDGTIGNIVEAARIQFKIDGTPAAGVAPTDIIFFTTTGGGALTEALRLKFDQSAVFAGRVQAGSAASATSEVIDTIAAPTANHGTLSADSSDFMGRITTIGANTSVTLTFGSAAGTTSHCRASSSSATLGVAVTTQSASAPVFSCTTLTTGAAVNCPDFDYECWKH